MPLHLASSIAVVLMLAVGASAQQPSPPSAAKILGKSTPHALLEAAPEGASLVGMIVWVNPVDRNKLMNMPIVVGLELHYASSQGPVIAGPFGETAATPIRLEAKPGYVVAGLIGRGSDRVDGFRLLFRKSTNGQLDPADPYESRWVGNRGQHASDVTLAADGQPILGLRYYLDKESLSGFALIQTREQLEAPAAPVVPSQPIEQIVKAVSESGGIITRDESDPQRPIVAIDRSGWKTVDGDMTPLQGLTTLKRLNLSASYVVLRGAGADVFATLTGLEELNLSQAVIGDNVLLGLRNLSKLKSLDLMGTTVSEKGTVHLKGLKSLETLRLGRPQQFAVIGDATMDHIQGLTNLQELVLDSTVVSDAGFANVAKLTRLKRLGLGSGVIGNDGLKALEELQELEGVALVGRGFTSDALSHVHAKNLNSLTLDGQQYDDALGPHLQRFPHLKQLRILGTKLSDEGIVHLNDLAELETLDLFMGRLSGTGLAKLDRLKNLKKLILRNNPLAPEGLECLQCFPQLEFLDLAYAKLPEAALVNLKQVPGLKDLDLSGMRFSDDGLAPLALLPQLERLTLAQVSLGGGVYKHLVNSKKLRSLTIRSHGLGDEEAEELGRLTSLRELRLVEASITDRLLTEIGKLTNLETLSLSGTTSVIQAGGPLNLEQPAVPKSNFSADGMAHLAKLRNLQVLDLALMPVGDKTVEQLVRLSKLRSLNLQGARITDAGLDRLAELPELQTLDVQLTKVSRDAINRFKNKRRTVRLIGMFR